jgi:hypothetical protein
MRDVIKHEAWSGRIVFLASKGTLLLSQMSFDKYAR